jgi:hypothetical protein
VRDPAWQARRWLGRPPERARAAEDKLRYWTAGSRDDDVREAAGAGLSTACIQKITGLAITTIERILNKPPTRGRHRG